MSDEQTTPRLMTAEQISAALSPILGSADVGIVRKDRHNPTSEILMLVIDVDALSYDAMTQVAGVFETPNITITSMVEANDNEPDEGCSDPDGPCEHCLPTSRVRLKVRW